MDKENIHSNNPLQGVGLKQVLDELVTYYGFDILYAYLNMNCFKTNPSIAACAKFLKKTEWARQKVELFYLYQYKNLPTVSSEQFDVAPRERIIPEDQKPGEPAILTIEGGESLQQKRARNADSRNSFSGQRKGSGNAYNGRRNERQFKSSTGGSGGRNYRADDRKAEPSSDNDAADGFVETKPVPAFNPWENLKPRRR